MKQKLIPIGKIKAPGPKGQPGLVNLYHILYTDTKKNTAYMEKRRKLGEEATKELGVTCFG